MADVTIKPANPAPLGLVAFGLTTVVLSAVNAGLLPKEAEPVVFPLAIAFGGLGQIIAGAMEFRNNNTFGTVAFTSFGLFWWWFAFLNWAVGAKIQAAPAATGVGVTLFMWGVFTLYMWISTFRSNIGLWLVFLTLWLTFFLLAGDAMGGGTKTIGGYMGLASGLLAMYVSFAEVTNATFGRSVIPLGRQILGPTPGAAVASSKGTPAD